MTSKQRVVFTQEFRDAMVKRLVHEGMSLQQLSRETGVGKSTLSKWRSRAADRITDEPLTGQNVAGTRSSEDKFHVVMETYSLNETELGEYCRAKGLYPEQVAEWRKACMQANAQQAALHHRLRQELKDEKQIKADMARELRRKEKALAEAAALLVLRKKAEAIWGDQGEE